jgi:hypothetical protein
MTAAEKDDFPGECSEYDVTGKEKYTLPAQKPERAECAPVPTGLLNRLESRKRKR